MSIEEERLFRPWSLFRHYGDRLLNSKEESREKGKGVSKYHFYIQEEIIKLSNSNRPILQNFKIQTDLRQKIPRAPAQPCAPAQKIKIYILNQCNFYVGRIFYENQ